MQRGRIMTMTELTERSDGAIHLAGTLAARNAWDLDILCPLDGAARLAPHEDSNRELGRSIQAADRAARLQAGRLVPRAQRPHAPIIDLDGPRDALLRRAVQFRPLLAVLPPIWTWVSHDRSQQTLDAAMLEQCGVPVLIAGASDASRSERMVIVSVPGAFDARQLRIAWRWRSWLQRMLQPNHVEQVPEVDVILCEPGETPVPDIGAAHAALVLVSAEAQRASRDSAPVAGALAALLHGAAAPILLLPVRAAVPRLVEPRARTAWDRPLRAAKSWIG